MKIKINQYDVQDAIFVLLLILVIIGVIAVIHKQTEPKPNPKDMKTIIDG